MTAYIPATPTPAPRFLPADPHLDVDATKSALRFAAVALQARFLEEYGECYHLEEMQAALTRWLELSIESLVEDVLFHTVEGDRACAFNRRAFEAQLRKNSACRNSRPPSSGSIGFSV